MKKLIFLTLAAFALIIISCTPETCPPTKICTDGTVVQRIGGVACEYTICPEEPITPQPTPGCDFNQTGKQYIGRSLEECSRIKFLCEPNFEYFKDECGCGCTEKPFGNQSSRECTEPRPQVCMAQYDPVCGYYNQTIQCLRVPCADTYGNSCEACSDEKVAYWERGRCPE